jgi:hypothetical protein
MSLRDHLVVKDEKFLVGDQLFFFDGEFIFNCALMMRFDRTSSISVGTLQFKNDVLTCGGESVYLRFDERAPKRNILLKNVNAFNVGGHFYTAKGESRRNVTCTGVANVAGDIILIQSYSFGEHSTLDMPGVHRYHDGILTVNDESVKLIFP